MRHPLSGKTPGEHRTQPVGVNVASLVNFRNTHLSVAETREANSKTPEERRDGKAVRNQGKLHLITCNGLLIDGLTKRNLPVESHDTMLSFI